MLIFNNKTTRTGIWSIMLLKNMTWNKIADAGKNRGEKNLNRSYVFAYYFIRGIPLGKPLFWYAEQITEVKFLIKTEKSRMFWAYVSGI